MKLIDFFRRDGEVRRDLARTLEQIGDLIGIVNDLAQRVLELERRTTLERPRVDPGREANE